MSQKLPLFEPFLLPCGVTLKNRIAKSAMSDSLGDGTGHPTKDQISLYQKWAEGGAALSIIGEVQGHPGFVEKPGNLVLNDKADLEPFRDLAKAGGAHGTQLWLQLGHAGALAYAPTSTPRGPSALDLPGLQCAELSKADICQIPEDFARTAELAKQTGFGGVQIHAAHGFLLSQFLSPLFNNRRDAYGGSVANRMRLLVESIEAVRSTVGSRFPVGLKLNSSDQLEGGLSEQEALEVIAALDKTSIDLIDISGGTYFPGAKAASDGAGKGPYFLDFAKRARTMTTKPLMATGGFKTHHQAEQAVASGATDLVGLARALVLDPSLPKHWQANRMPEPSFPRFTATPDGGVTAWYTMQMTKIARGEDDSTDQDIWQAIKAYDERDDERTRIWLKHFCQGQ
ncbi:NADH:flavin oxidoreductase/NADH oxidase family protein [Cohaesibacter intestini]|uniref:NADH:flavin oxidoreductase/NADH oxidase family protein n=1 Tax=Cohaesibacter intestini TaxID=2211145 RepID=UPI000DE9D764|nr:NADH:flavin oxidoreductase/NADH oxidase family protein [Cohaesibacter intestini]